MLSIALSRQMSLEPTQGDAGCDGECGQQQMQPQRARSYNCKTASAYSSPFMGLMSGLGVVGSEAFFVASSAPGHEETAENNRKINARGRSIRMVYLSWLVVRDHGRGSITVKVCPFHNISQERGRIIVNLRAIGRTPMISVFTQVDL